VDFDYEYLCQNLGHLSGLPTRVYESGKLIHSYSNVEFSPDLSELILSAAEANPNTISYFYAADSLFFGVLKKNAKHLMLIIGPTYRINMTKERFEAILRALGEPHERLPELEKYLMCIPPYPLDSFLQILCFINYALNNEKLTIAELLARETTLINFGDPDQKSRDPISRDEVALHNTYETEKTIFSFVRSGQPDALRAFFSQPPTGRVGKIAHDELRQLKNTFVCAATLASRAAIEGGLSQETVFTLSDLYIQKVEILGNYNDITKLNMDMLLDLSTRVEKLKCHGIKSKLTTRVVRFINANLDKKLTTADIAQELQMNRSHLCDRFKLETGVTLNDFITEIKIEEARRLLISTDKPVAQISDYLGFSSQSYFQNVFKKQTGKTPKEFRGSNF